MLIFEKTNLIKFTKKLPLISLRPKKYIFVLALPPPPPPAFTRKDLSGLAKLYNFCFQVFLTMLLLDTDTVRINKYCKMLDVRHWLESRRLQNQPLYLSVPYSMFSVHLCLSFPLPAFLAACLYICVCLCLSVSVCLSVTVSILWK
jgi:hypothetical protein